MKVSNSACFSLVFFGFLTISSSAYAEEPKVALTGMMLEKDANTDGYLSIEEMNNDTFVKTDTNKDGKISAEELNNKFTPDDLAQAETNFQKLDSNMDHSVSKEEFLPVFAASAFKKLDLNQDKKISGYEICVGFHGADACKKSAK